MAQGGRWFGVVRQGGGHFQPFAAPAARHAVLVDERVAQQPTAAVGAAQLVLHLVVERHHLPDGLPVRRKARTVSLGAACGELRRPPRASTLLRRRSGVRRRAPSLQTAQGGRRAAALKPGEGRGSARPACPSSRIDDLSAWIFVPKTSKACAL